jgi:hypothetical protein
VGAGIWITRKERRLGPTVFDELGQHLRFAEDPFRGSHERDFPHRRFVQHFLALGGKHLCFGEGNVLLQQGEFDLVVIVADGETAEGDRCSQFMLQENEVSVKANAGIIGVKQSGRR